MNGGAPNMERLALAIQKERDAYAQIIHWQKEARLATRERKAIERAYKTKVVPSNEFKVIPAIE